MVGSYSAVGHAIHFSIIIPGRTLVSFYSYIFMADQSQQALEFKNWIRNVIAEEEKKRAVFNHSLLNEYNRYRNAFVDDDPEFNSIDSLQPTCRRHLYGVDVIEYLL